MKLIIPLIFVLLSGCTTIHFDKDNNVEPSTSQIHKWHHNIIFGLAEVSEPVNLEQECQDKEWTSVQTELSFIDGFTTLIVNSFAPLWYPKSVEISCK